MGFIEGQAAALSAMRKKTEAFDWKKCGEGLSDVFAHAHAHGAAIDHLEIVMPARDGETVVFEIKRTIRKVTPGLRVVLAVKP